MSTPELFLGRNKKQISYIHCEYSFVLSSRGKSHVCPQSMFSSRNKMNNAHLCKPHIMSKLGSKKAILQANYI